MYNVAVSEYPPTIAVPAIAASAKAAAPCELERWYRAEFDRMVALARAFTGRDEAFCLDVVQDVTLRVARRVRSIPTGGGGAAWTATLVRRAAIDRLRADRRRTSREASVARADGASPTLGWDERVAMVRAAFAGLSADERDLLVQRFVRDSTLRALAGDGSPHAVHGRIRRVLARARLGAEAAS